MSRLVIGSEEHKQRLCRVFIDTHDPFTPEGLPWPDLDADTRARLLSLPVWDEAVNTERETADKVQRIMEQAHERVRGILTRERAVLDRVAARLLEREVMDGDELRTLLGPRAAAVPAAPTPA